jgi:hypothetical protein
MARKAFNPNWKRDGHWQVISAIPADASETTKRLLGIAQRADGVVVLSSPKFPSILRVRYSDPPYALMTIRSFTRQEPTVTITPRLQDRAFHKVFKEAFPEADAMAWKPGKPPYSAEPRFVGEPTRLVSEVEKILPRMIERILTNEHAKRRMST